MINNNFKIELIKSLKKRKNFYNLIDKLKYKIICEIGVWDGFNLKNLLKSKANKVYGVDPYCFEFINDKKIKYTINEINIIFNEVKKLEVIFKNLKIIKKKSEEAVNFFNDNYFDFIYIDGNHTYDYVKNDLNLWFPKLKLNGILAGHDYCNYTFKNGEKFGVIKAVNEFSIKNNLKFYLTDQDEIPSWIFLKQ